MNILVLTKMKTQFLKKDVKNVNDYLKYDYSFDGFVNGFKKQGFNIFLIWDESFFLKPILKRKYFFVWKVLYFLFRKTKFYKIDRYLFSRKIVKYCFMNNIDCIYTEINSFISPKIIKKYNKKILITQWYGVFPEMSCKDTLNILSEYDIIWGPCEFDKSKVNFDGIEKLKFVGCAVNEKVFYYDYDERYKYDIVFVGGVGKAHSNRIKILEKIAQKYENFAFYGYGIENIPGSYVLKDKYKGWADISTIRKLYSSSKIILNLTLDNYDRVKKGFNSRLFEIAACNGGVQIVKYDNKILDFFEPNIDLLTFRTTKELFKQIENILLDQDRRKKMSNSAYKKAFKYTYYEKSKIMCTIVKGEK